MLTQEKILAGLGLLAVVVILGCGVLSAILFAKANEVEEAKAKRRLSRPTELAQSGATGKLLPEAGINPIPSVTERTIELLFAERKGGGQGS